MSSNNYSNTLRNENQGYTFNGVPPYFPQCSTDEQLPNAYPTNIINVGLSGPGTHLEETTSAIVPAVVKSSGRGRKKNRKKISRIDSLNEPLRIDSIEDVDASEDINMSRIQDAVQDDSIFGTHANSDVLLTHDNQVLLNNNTLAQILSYKKMLLLQSPEVVEFISKHQPKHLPNKKRGQQ